MFFFQGAKLNSANLKGANLQRAYLRHVNLRDTVSNVNMTFNFQLAAVISFFSLA